MTPPLDTEPSATATNGTPDKRNRLRGLFRLALVGMVFLAISLFIGAALWTWIDAAGLTTVDAYLEAIKPWLILWRIILFALVIGAWPHGVDWLATRRNWPSARRQALLGLRWRVAAWWALLELFLAQNLIGRALGY